MNKEHKTYILLAITALAILSLFFINPIPQDPEYHHFADQRTMFSIPNFLNVFSNIFFVITGFLGLSSLSGKEKDSFKFHLLFFLFLGILLTGLGSAWYHLHPDNNTLVWDRIPMTIVFNSLMCFILFQRINPATSKIIYFPFLIAGILSVLYWKHTEAVGQGDLRFYAFFQFLPLILIPVILLLFPGAKKSTVQFILIAAFYVAAKICEHKDATVFSISNHLISGHSLKHIFASASTFIIYRLIKTKESSQFK